MTNLISYKSKFARTVAAILLVCQLGLSVTFLAYPKKSEAFLGIFDITFNTEIGNVYDMLKDIGLAALRRVAMNYANQFLSRFTDKLVAKYKIKSFLYYDQVLSDYYLLNFISDKISDPDLREIYTILQQTYVEGKDLGYTGTGIDPTKDAVIPKLRQKIQDVYEAKTGVSVNAVLRPDGKLSTNDYLRMQREFILRSPDMTGNDIVYTHNRISGEASTAAQLEILVGNGLKAGRIIGGSCSVSGAAVPKAGEQAKPQGSDPTATQAGCEMAGGKWTVSALDQARMFINNPGATVDKYLDSALKSVFNYTYDPNNIWSTIGDIFGQFIFKKLQMDGKDGIIKEYGDDYSADDGSTPPPNEIDLDNDGIPDGQDNNKDGQLTNVSDVCYHGGQPDVPLAGFPGSGCKRSSQVGSSPYFTPFCQAIDRSVSEVQKFLDYITLNKDQVDGDNFEYKADADNWSRRAQLATTSIDNLLRAIQAFNSDKFNQTEVAIGRFSDYMGAITTSLIQDKDLELDDDWGSWDGIDKIIETVRDNLEYIKKVKVQVNKCNDPDPDDLANIPVPAMPQPVVEVPPDPGPIPPDFEPGDIGSTNGDLTCFPNTQWGSTSNTVRIQTSGGIGPALTFTYPGAVLVEQSEFQIFLDYTAGGVYEVIINDPGDNNREVKCQVVIIK